MGVKNNENKEKTATKNTKQYGNGRHKGKEAKVPQNEERSFRNPCGTTEHTGLRTT